MHVKLEEGFGLLVTYTSIGKCSRPVLMIKWVGSKNWVLAGCMLELLFDYDVLEMYVSW